MTLITGRDISKILKTLAIAVFCFLFWTSFAVAASTTITSLPYTATQTGTNYSETLFVAGTHVSSATNGIQINGHDIVLNLGADTISFGTGNGNSNWGFRTWGDGTYAAYNIKIIGGVILHNPSDTTVLYNNCVRFSGGSNIYFENTEFIVNGIDGHIFDRPSSGYNIWNVEFNGGRWTSEVTAFASRCQYGGAVARLTNALQPVYGDDYHFKIHDVVMTKSPGQGLIVEGKCFVYNCSLTVDARNDYYTYPSGGVCNSAANSFAIITQKLVGGSYIRDNVIRSGTEHQGCDGGILLQMSMGSPGNPVLIEGNDVEVHRGHDAYYWDMNAKAFKSRYANKHVRITNNIFRGVVGDTTQSSYGINAMGIDLVTVYDEGCDWAEGRYPDSFLVFENNLFEAIALDSAFNNAICVRLAITDQNGYTWEGAGNVWRYNRIKTAKWGYRLGGYDGECHNMIIQEDTVEFTSVPWNNHSQYSYYLGYVWDAFKNTSLDGAYIGGATDTSIGFLNTEGERTLTLKKTLDIQVIGNNSAPVSNANVTVTNNYSQTVLNGVSNGAGQFSGVVSYWHEAEDGVDSTSFSNFTVKVKKGTDSTIYTTEVFSGTQVPVINLLNTAGDGESDLTAPEDIDDLSAINPQSTAITLTWTAPGDDGASGTATAYDIRYSTAYITESNWVSAIQISGTPTPKVAGSTEEFTVTGLAEGNSYFFAIRTRDDIHNWSGLSNIATGDVSDQTPPAAISNLDVAPGPGDGVFDLSWNAPGDDGSSGTASLYDIRYSTSFINEGNWSSATQAAGEPTPEMAGNSQSHTISGLTPNTTYYFAIKTRDESNWSNLSNVVSAGDFSDDTPPAFIADLGAVTGLSAGEIDLTWTATGDDGSTGTAGSYEIRYSSSTITELNWGNALTYDGAPTPVTSGTPISFTMSGLTPGEQFYIAVKARDDNSNYSDISNIASAVSMYGLVTETDGGFLLGPAYGSTVANSQPTLTVANVSTDPGNIYYFQLAENAGFSTILADDSLDQDPGGTTGWKTPIKLNSNQTYYWRVKPNTDEFSEYSLFIIAPLTHVYPNPFDINSNNMAVFTELPENSSLIIMSISGTTVKQWSNITGGEIYWNGTNESGNTVASGTYLWFVEDSELGGKIVVRH